MVFVKLDRRCFWLAVSVAVLLVLTAGSPAFSQSTYYVNDSDTTGDGFTNNAGNDVWTDAEAENNPDSPFLTIDRALKAVQPGDTIAIDSGVFTENLSADTDNLLIRGAGRDTAVIRGNVSKNGGSGFRIRDLTIENAGSAGISLSNFDTPTISNVTITGAGNEAILLSTVSGALVENSTGTGAGNEGLVFDAVSGSTITQSTFGNNDRAGIQLDGSSNNKVLNNTVTHNGQGGNFSGIEVLNSSNNNLVRNNTSRSNTSHGFEQSGSDDNDYRENVSTGNNQTGMRITGSARPALVFNLVQQNAQAGVRLNNSTNIRLFLNEIKKNTEYQISIGNSVTLDDQSKNNVIPSTTNGDSLVLNESSNTLSMTRNWWATTDTDVLDTGVINTGGGNISYIPFRLSIVDTAPGADTVAPAVPPNISVDTAFPGEVRIEWDESNANEENFPGLGQQINGFRVYRSQNFDRPDWKPVRINQQSQTDTNYIDTAVNTDTTYFYRITAFDSHTTMGSKFENESFYSKRFQAFVPSIGPGIFVNDTSTVGDEFTSSTGNDSHVGIPQSPVRTIGRALELAENGDTIFVDAGTYGETITVDTANITVIGAGQEKTFVDGSSVAGNGFTVTTGGFNMRSVTVRDFSGDGINVNSATNARLRNLTLRQNGDNGIDFNNGASNNYVAQVTFDSNASHQIRFNGGATTGNRVQYSNVFAPAGTPDSGVIDSNANSVEHNWWTTTDSSAIAGKITGSSVYIPHRLGIVDTGVNADTTAPSAPNLTVDTSTAQQLTLNWPAVTQDEDGSPLSGHQGVRIFKIKGVADTTDWAEHPVKTLPPGDTSWVDTDVEKSQPYSYRMTSFDTASPENSSYFSSVESGTWFNRAPIPDTEVLTTQVDSPVGVTLSGTDPDGDTLTFFVSTPPPNGTVSGTAPNLTYTPNTGFTGTDQFLFKITDGEDTSSAGTVTINVATNLQINISDIKTSAIDTPAVANGADSVFVVIDFENSGTADGVVLRDTDNLLVKDGLGSEVSDSFNVTLAGTDIVVPQGTTRTGTWIIPTEDSNQSALIGNFRARLDPPSVLLRDQVTNDTQFMTNSDTNRIPGNFTIVHEPDTYAPSAPADNLDQVVKTAQKVTFRGGEPGGSPAESMFDFSGVTASDGDSVFVVIQRGDVETEGSGPTRNSLDTPIVNPGYSINGEIDFENAVEQADQKLLDEQGGGDIQFVDTGLVSITLWLKTVNGTYIGNATELNEEVDVLVDNVTLPSGVSDPGRLEVRKLVFDGGWEWRRIQDLNNLTSSTFNNQITFTVSKNESDDVAGFSVFRIIASGFSTGGTADETVVYPNPFVPTDGNNETGRYPAQGGDGVLFGAGQNKGFPSNTTLKIYTIRGRQITELTTGAGGVISWDAHTENGEPVASGVYIYRIEVPGAGDKVGKFSIVR